MNGDGQSHGLWEASALPPPPTHRLHEALRVDLVVVGGGFTGLSAALHCVQAGMTVAVLEAQDIGFGGSGRNVGLVNAGMWVMPEEIPRELGNIYGPRLLDVLGNGPTTVFEIIQRYNIKCEAIRNGTLHCAVGKRGLKDIQERSRQWQALGAPVRVLSAEDTAARTGTRAYAGALLDQRAGTVQPLAYVRGLAHAAVSEGAKIFTESRVHLVTDEGSAWRLECSNGSVTAEHVVVATNAYTPEDSPWAVLRTELVKLPYFNMATRPLPRSLQRSILPERQGAWDTAEVMSSFRFDQAGRLIFGSIGALRGVGRTVHQDWGIRAMEKLFPALRGVGFEHQWYGWIGMTHNNLPRMHQLARNTFSFSGYNGRGISPGTVFGREIARLITGKAKVQDMPLPVSHIAGVPLRSARAQFYEQGAVAAHFVGARI